MKIISSLTICFLLVCTGNTERTIEKPVEKPVKQNNYNLCKCTNISFYSTELPRCRCVCRDGSVDTEKLCEGR